MLVRKNQLVLAIGQTDIYHFITISNVDGNHAFRAWVRISL